MSSYEDAFRVASYSELVRLREALVSRQTLDIDQYALFARSVLTAADVRLLESAALESESGDTAGWILLRLYTMARIGRLTPVMLSWLEREADMSDALVMIGVVLNALVQQFADGTALRALYEFSHHADIELNLRRVLSDIGEERADQLLRMSRASQLEELLAKDGDETASGIWALRAYADVPAVRQYLEPRAKAGSLGAVAGLLYGAAPIEWSLFDHVAIDTQIDRRMAINLAIENARQGADIDAVQRSMLWSKLSEEERSEFLIWLAVP